MKNSLQIIGAVALVASTLLLAGCEPEIEKMSVSKGELNLDKYVAVGNSLTAGFMDNGLYREGQESSYPNILAGQFKQVGGGDFTQPLFTPEQENGSGYLRLSGFSPTGTPVLSPVTDKLAIRSQNPTLYTKYPEEINNLGVPGIRMSDIKMVGYGSSQGNPYFERISTDPQQTYLARVAASNATFFSCWLGNNDVLGYATAGAFANSITPTDVFTANNSEVINTLTANGAKGIVATIPDVTGIPFFTTVGPTVKGLLASAGVPGMVALTRNSSARIQFARTDIKDAAGGTILFPLTSISYLPLIGQPTGKYWRDLAKQVVPANPALGLLGILLNFQIDTTKVFGLSSGNPWPSALLLDAVEQKDISDATINFNTILKAKASEKNLAVFDAYTYFNSIQSGMTQNGVPYSPAFITGNLFSLDGVHLTPRGYAIVANEMIKAINTQYNARIPTADVTQYRAVLFP
ncbi:SGNH/GDSL hydrolase family protein [Adhaeribacter radiodurans]|uniref:SGNH/GDSL hydrolase family protein n=1 Tax=Adhaeribacter radiodurans TaxID=2745197 RepID=A0A7L7LCV4_9BACT|nr:SGNH/GDSL hydrolase family protein [Adhaeribacter radiodurans]QMU30209.1 SGNH/GDSL hydrolase family protein [Adhaeribacter radiodurans]